MLALTDSLAENLAVIPNGVFADEFKDLKPSSEVREKYGLGENRIVLSVGRLLYRKGFHDLINAALGIVEEHPDAKIVILGPDHGEQSNLELMIEKKGLKKHCMLFGPAETEVVKQFLSICDVFVVPSLYEGLPTTLLEAMAAGKPVVGSNIESIADVVTDGVDGLLIPPHSPLELSKKVNQLLNDEGLSKRLGNKAENSIQKYDWNIIGKNIFRIYESTLS
jgi:glycosyltransferase involved in cell wall biosynthesis